MALTLEQRTWLDDLGRIVGKAAPEDDAGDAGDAGSAASDMGVEAFLPPAVIVDILIPDLITSRVTIKNESGAALRIVQGSAKLLRPRLSRFDPWPPEDIPAGKTRDFTVTNKGILIPRPVGTSGEVTYEVVGGAESVQFYMRWQRRFPLPLRDTEQHITPDDGSFSLQGEGSGGVAGFARGGAVVTLEDRGTETLLSYNASAEVGGKIAQLGNRLIAGTAKKLADQFFTSFAAAVTTSQKA